MAGFVLVVNCRGLAEFEEFTDRRFCGNGDVRHFTSSLVLERVKVGLTIPLDGG